MAGTTSTDPYVYEAPWRPFGGLGRDFSYGTADDVQALFGVPDVGWAEFSTSDGSRPGVATTAFGHTGGNIFGNDIYNTGLAAERFPGWYTIANYVLWSTKEPVTSRVFADRISIGAADLRGNYAVCIEEVTYHTGAPSSNLIDQATGTGNMLLFTGGPDLLTGATVHTLVASSTNELVAVGVF